MIYTVQVFSMQRAIDDKQFAWAGHVENNVPFLLCTDTGARASWLQAHIERDALFGRAHVIWHVSEKPWPYELPYAFFTWGEPGPLLTETMALLLAKAVQVNKEW